MSLVTQERMRKVVGVLWLLDALIGVFCIAGAADIAFAPGRIATFESGTLAIVVICISLLIVLAAISPGFLIHTWVRALERFIGKGLSYVLLGILVSSPTVVWRLVCGGLTVAVGFAYILFSACQRSIHPRPLLSSGTEEGIVTSIAPPTAGAGAGPAGGSGSAAAPRLDVRPTFAASASQEASEEAPPVASPKRSSNPFLN
jgi:hypothetical protein